MLASYDSASGAGGAIGRTDNRLSFHGRNMDDGASVAPAGGDIFY
jgi:hypothetical protein